MNILDIIILVLLVPGVIVGMVKGFIEQAMGIIGLALGVYLSSRFTPVAGGWITQLFPAIEGKGVNIVAFIVILIVVMLLITLAGKVLSRVFKIALLGWADSILGGVFALVKYVIVFALIVCLFNSINGIFQFVDHSSLAESHLWMALERVSSSILPYLHGVLGI